MTAAAHRREADAAKASMLANAEALKARLSPAALVDNAFETACETAIGVAEQTVETARARPALTGSIAGGILFFLVRKPALGLFARIAGRKRLDDDASNSELDQIEGHPS
jgi:hypothetical protein